MLNMTHEQGRRLGANLLTRESTCSYKFPREYIPLCQERSIPAYNKRVILLLKYHHHFHKFVEEMRGIDHNFHKFDYLLCKLFLIGIVCRVFYTNLGTRQRH